MIIADNVVNEVSRLLHDKTRSRSRSFLQIKNIRLGDKQPAHRNRFGSTSEFTSHSDAICGYDLLIIDGSRSTLATGFHWIAHPESNYQTTTAQNISKAEKVPSTDTGKSIRMDTGPWHTRQGR